MAFPTWGPNLVFHTLGTEGDYHQTTRPLCHPPTHPHCPTLNPFPPQCKAQRAELRKGMLGARTWVALGLGSGTMGSPWGQEKQTPGFPSELRVWGPEVRVLGLSGHLSPHPLSWASGPRDQSLCLLHPSRVPQSRWGNRCWGWGVMRKRETGKQELGQGRVPDAREPVGAEAQTPGMVGTGKDWTLKCPHFPLPGPAASCEELTVDWGPQSLSRPLALNLHPGMPLVWASLGHPGGRGRPHLPQPGLTAHVPTAVGHMQTLPPLAPDERPHPLPSQGAWRHFAPTWVTAARLALSGILLRTSPPCPLSLLLDSSGGGTLWPLAP